MSEFISRVAGKVAEDLIAKAISRGFNRIWNAPIEAGDVASDLPMDPFVAPEATAVAFLEALAAGDSDAAWSWCDQTASDDPDRATLFAELFEAAPPVSWAFRSFHCPADWDDTQELLWVGIEGVVTFDLGGGTYDTLPCLLWMAAMDTDWAVWSIEWHPEPA